jgi:hypothetical protein
MQKRQVPGRFVHVSISETNTERPAICGKLVYRVPDLKTKARFIEPMLLQRAEELPQGWSWMYQLNDAEVRNINAIAPSPGKRTRREDHALLIVRGEFRPAIPRSGWSPPEPVSASPTRPA